MRERYQRGSTKKAVINNTEQKIPSAAKQSSRMGTRRARTCVKMWIRFADYLRAYPICPRSLCRGEDAQSWGTAQDGQRDVGGGLYPPRR